MTAAATVSPPAEARLPWPALLLPSRLFLFAAAQGLLALALGGGWAAAAKFWPLTAAAANVVSLALLAAALRAESLPLSSAWRPARAPLRHDAKWLAALFVILGPVGWLPNVALAWLLYADPAAPSAALVHPLPVWAAWSALVLFPLTVALTELPTYFGYLRPRLEARHGKLAALALTSGFLSLQHVALPLVLDARYLVWRGLMFLPFAVLVGWALRRRPSLMPYFIGVHALLDGATAATVLDASLG